MIKIKLNQHHDCSHLADSYALDPTEKYIIDLSNELDTQFSILCAFQTVGYPPAIKNNHAWLFENKFNVENPNPTNESVAPYYGVNPLWKTAYSIGIVVKNENDDDYYIVMECSNLNRGFVHTQVVLTLGGCI